MTLKQFEKLEPRKIFATGLLRNSPAGLNMTNSHQGEMLRWIAKKGYAPQGDWAIYCHWAINTVEYVEEQGDKVTMQSNILKCVRCSKDVLKLYRL